MSKIKVFEREVSVISVQEEDVICLTDIARYKDPERTDYIILNWMRNRNSIEFLGIWEQLNNPNFNPIEFDGIKSQAGLNSFILTAKQWVEKTGAIGITSKAGRYGVTYAHKDIAFKFASWISVEFKLYLIKEFQRLKGKYSPKAWILGERQGASRRFLCGNRRLPPCRSQLRRIFTLKEQAQKALGWDIRRNLAKINYRIHTDAIQTHLIPPQLTKSQTALVYASEADVLNMALFGKTAAQWRLENPKEKGNIRDQANSAQLVCLSNLENLWRAVHLRERLPVGPAAATHSDCHRADEAAHHRPPTPQASGEQVTMDKRKLKMDNGQWAARPRCSFSIFNCPLLRTIRRLR